METIQFTLAYNDKLKANWIKQSYLIKHKRKVKAQIFEYTNGTFRVEINGISWEKKNIDECMERIIENYSSFLKALNKPAKIEIVNAPDVTTYTYYSIEHRDKEDNEVWFFHIIRENRDAAKSQLFTYPPKESDIIDIKAYPINIAYVNSTGFTCLERGLFSDNQFEPLMHDMK